MAVELKERQAEELKLWRRWMSGDKGALGPLLKSYEPLVQKQLNELSGSDLPKVFIKTETQKQILDSFKTYDPKQGTQLNTWVTSRLPKVLRNTVYTYGNIGRIPEERQRKISTFQASKDRLTESLRRPPTAMELAADLSWDLKEIERMEKELRPTRLLTEEGEFTFASDDDDKKLLQLVYHSLPAPQQLVMEHTFGWAGKPQMKDADLATTLGVTLPEVKSLKNDLAEKLEKALQLKI